MSSQLHPHILCPAQGTEFTSSTSQNDVNIGTDPRVANATRQIYPNDKCVAQLVAARAAIAPNALAVVAGSDQLTYGELERRSNQLAHYLIAIGAGRESIIALCFSRSVEAVV